VGNDLATPPSSVIQPYLIGCHDAVSGRI